MLPIRTYAAAKLNLTLDILGRREDGYHLLDMVMQSVSIFDTLVLSERSHGEITVLCDNSWIPCDETNTVHKAASLFFEAAKLEPRPVEIRITKRIPFQAGLAGGSSDAAAALHALNRMYNGSLTTQALCKIGQRVGADVPFCLCGGTRRVQGIGELLSPLPPLPQCWFVVCKPKVGVDTKKAYALADSGALSPKRHTAALAEALDGGSAPEIAACIGNAFEEILRLPQVEALKAELLEHGALNACMTGSGSAVFGIFPNRPLAEGCRAALLNSYEQVFVCEPLKTPFW